MFNIRIGEDGTVYLSGRLDASQVEAAEAVLGTLTASTVADLSDLDYVSSAGIGVLLKTYKRLNDAGAALRLVNLNPRIRTIFHYAGLGSLFPLD